MRYRVGPEADLPAGSFKAIQAGKVPVVVVRTPDGGLHALVGLCPHQRGPLTKGRLTGTTLPGLMGEYRYGRVGEVLRCPWHGFEFDVTTGSCLGDPERFSARTFPVFVEDGSVTVEV